MPDSSDTAMADSEEDLPVGPDAVPSGWDGGLGESAQAVQTPVTVPVPRTAAGGVRPRGRDRVRYLSGRGRQVMRSRGDILAVIAAGGALGSLARYGLGLLWPHPAGAFPWATFITNVTGCLLLGALMVFLVEALPPSRYLRPFLGVGVLGGFTTFSTYMLDARELLVSNRTALAGEYVFGGLLGGVVAVWAGAGGTRLLIRLARRRFAAGRDRPAAPGRTSPSPGPAALPRAGSARRAGHLRHHRDTRALAPHEAHRG
jgi:CrcB protein